MKRPLSPLDVTKMEKQIEERLEEMKELSVAEKLEERIDQEVIDKFHEINIERTE